MTFLILGNSNISPTVELSDTSNEKKMVYYTGNFAEDVLNNFTEKQSEKLFKKMRGYHDNFIFVQRKVDQGAEDINGYEYIVAKK